MENEKAILVMHKATKFRFLSILDRLPPMLAGASSTISPVLSELSRSEDRVIVRNTAIDVTGKMTLKRKSCRRLKKTVSTLAIRGPTKRAAAMEVK